MSISVFENDLIEVDLPAIRRVVFGSVDYAAGGSYGPRQQLGLQFVMLDRGAVEVEVEGRRRQLGPGQVTAQWPGRQERFRFSTTQRSRHRWLDIIWERPGSAAVAAWCGRMEAAWPVVREESPAMRRLFELGLGTGGAGADDAAAGPGQRGGAGSGGIERGGAVPAAAGVPLGLAYAAAYGTHDELAAAGTAAAAGTLPRPPALERMLTMIRESYARPLELADLAAAGSVTPSHLVRLCRRHLQTTPMRLLWDTRAERGVDLLRRTGLSVAEVAYQVGFNNPFHFSRAIKAKTGLPPREVRRRDWGMQGEN